MLNIQLPTTFALGALSDKKPAARSAVVASVYEQPVSIFQQLT